MYNNNISFTSNKIKYIIKKLLLSPNVSFLFSLTRKQTNKQKKITTTSAKITWKKKLIENINKNYNSITETITLMITTVASFSPPSE